jgi:hypothetical protein
MNADPIIRNKQRAVAHAIAQQRRIRPHDQTRACSRLICTESLWACDKGVRPEGFEPGSKRSSFTRHVAGLQGIRQRIRHFDVVWVVPRLSAENRLGPLATTQAWQPNGNDR